MVKGFYDGNMRIKTESSYHVRTQLILDIYGKLGISDTEKSQLKPVDKEMPFLGKDVRDDPIQQSSAFKVAVRPSVWGTELICRQYMLIVSTE
jgi:hypothetical protein